MSDYTQITDFSAKDSLLAGDPNKLIKGSDVDAEFAALSVAIATKYDSTDVASQAEAEAGTSSAKLMTPERVTDWLAVRLTADFNFTADVTIGSNTDVSPNFIMNGSAVGTHTIAFNKAGVLDSYIRYVPDDAEMKIVNYSGASVNSAITLTAAAVNISTGALQVGGAVVPTVSSTSTLTNKTLTTPTLTSPVFNTGVSGTAVLDEDDLATDSATQLATQQSIKAYVDSLIPSTVYKTADTARISTTTLADDPDLMIAALASTVYVMEGQLFLTAGSSTHDLKMALSLPVGATGRWSMNGEIDNFRANSYQQFDDNNRFVEMDTSGSVHAYQFRALITMDTTAGDVGIQWAQNGSEAVNLTMKKDSWLSIRKVG